MGKGTGIFFTLAGLVAWEISAHMLGFPDAIDLVKDMTNGFADHVGKGLVVPFEYIGQYGRDFAYDNWAKLGLGGQVSTYGGLSNLIYNTLKRPEKEEPTEGE